MLTPLRAIILQSAAYQPEVWRLQPLGHVRRPFDKRLDHGLRKSTLVYPVGVSCSTINTGSERDAA